MHQEEIGLAWRHIFGSHQHINSVSKWCLKPWSRWNLHGNEYNCDSEEDWGLHKFARWGETSKRDWEATIGEMGKWRECRNQVKGWRGVSSWSSCCYSVSIRTEHRSSDRFNSAYMVIGDCHESCFCGLVGVKPVSVGAYERNWG